MIIAFNTYFIKRKKAGIGRYSEDLLLSLKRLVKNAKISEIGNPLGLDKFLFEQVYLPLKLWTEKAAVYLSTSIVLPFILPCRAVLVIYDLVFKVHPQYYRGKINLAYLNAFLPRSLNNARRIIAISQSTKNDLINYYNILPDKIRVIYPAVNDKYRPVADPSRSIKIRQKYQLPEKYILFVGTLEPRKNVEGLIGAYAQLPSDMRNKHKLVICGKAGWGKVAQGASAGSNIVYLDYIDDNDLPDIYRMAGLFIYPSFYEGFGLPVLEAMSCGVPVITSNTSSMPEVAGDAAVLVDPRDPGQLSDAMKKVLEDDVLASTMRNKGFAQAKKFSWDKTAQETMDVIREVSIS